MTLEELKIVISAETEPLKKELKEVSKQLGGLQNETNKATSGIKSMFSKLVKGVIALKIGQKIGQAITSGIREAMNVEAAVQQIKRIMGESTNQFLKWANTQAIAFNMSKSQALKYGAVFGNLISGFAKSSGEAMTYTTDLLKASSIIASSTGRSMQDVMERIRSGLLGNTEAIEDLGVNVNIAMIESTEAFKKFANGRSWNQIDFQTQQQIRLMAILEQTHKKYGDTVAQNTSSQLQQLVAILGNVKLSLGQAFLPIVQVVLPVLIKLAQGLNYVMNIIAQFSQALFGKSTGKQQAQNTNAQAKAMANLGNATEKAGKQAKGALAGFDEINSLGGADNSAASTGGGTVGGGSPMEMPSINKGSFLDDVAQVSEEVGKMADKVKAKFEDMRMFVEENKDSILSALGGLAAGFAAFEIISNLGAITAGVTEAVAALGVAISGISLPILAVAALITLLVGNLIYLWKTNDDFRGSVKEIWQDISDFITKVINDMWCIVKDIWDKYGKDIVDGLKGAMKSIQDTILNVWEVIKPIIQGALEMLKWLWDEHLKDLVKQVGEFIAKLVSGALEIYNKFISPIINWLIKILGPVVSNVITHIINVFGTLVAGIADVAKGIFKVLGGVVDFITGVFTGNWKKAWQGVKDILKGVFDALVGIVKVPLNLIIDAVNFVIRGLSKLSIKIPDWVPGFGGKTWGINIPTIPKLARGGIIDSPTLAMVGEAGKEAVMPLENNTGWIDELASKIKAKGGNDGPLTVILRVGKTELARVVADGINDLKRQNGELILDI